VDGPRYRLFSPIFQAYLRNRHGAGQVQANARMGATYPVQQCELQWQHEQSNDDLIRSMALLEKLVP
jgi:hypothetical protein